MRVTNNMMNMRLITNINNSFEKLNTHNQQLTTGQKIHRPGDNPVGIGYLMRYNTELARSEEFLENANTGISWLRNMDTLMNQAVQVLQRARVIAQQASTGSMSEDGRLAVAAEMKQLREQMVMIANSEFNGRFIFNGQKTDIQPYHSDTAADDVTDRGVYQLAVSPSVVVPVTIPGEQIFGEAGSLQNVFKVLGDAVKHLEDNNQDEILQDMDRISERLDHIQLNWSEIGARTNRFELVASRIKDDQINTKSLRAELNDVDMSKVIIDFKTQESVHQAALSTGARMMQVSLIDFLR